MNTDTTNDQESSTPEDFLINHPKATADAPKFIEFDWEALRQLLHEKREELGAADFQLLGQCLGEILRWNVKGDRLHIIGRRTVALSWVVNPAIFDGVSAAKLARRVGCHKAMLSQDAADFSREFKIRNRAQMHGGNFKP